MSRKKFRIAEVRDHYLNEPRTDSKLLESFIGNAELSQCLLKHFGGWFGLCTASTTNLRTWGLNEQQIATITALLPITQRLLLGEEIRPRIINVESAAALVQLDMGQLNQEELRTICLDSKNNLICVHTVYIGNICSATVRVGEVFKKAIEVNASAIIAVHNHPSQDPTPSPEDVITTRSLVKAGILLDIEFLDHIIIGGPRFVSMRHLGRGFDD